jgi:hypothetical protein
VVRVTDIGAVVIVDPLIGEVVISEFAPAVEIPKKPSRAKAAKNCRTRVNFT